MVSPRRLLRAACQSQVMLRWAHFRPLDLKMTGMVIKILPAYKDNYMYMLICRATNEAAVVDPVDADLVLRVTKENRLRLTKILTTHHHRGHASGNKKLVRHIQQWYNRPLEVFGNDDRIPKQIFQASEGRCFRVGRINCNCIETPCHTKGHVCYYAMSLNQRAVFTGDTLFQGGVGTFYEGTAEQMYEALYEKLGRLRHDTLIFPGHENTLACLSYSQHVEPNNIAVTKRLQWAKKRVAARMPTLPSNIGQERAWNPFMRAHKKHIQRYARTKGTIPTIRNLRLENDTFVAV